MLLKVLEIIVVGALLTKRALRGPQIHFARLAYLFILAGVVALMSASRQGDIASWLSALLILAGMLVALAMVVTDMTWVLSARNRKQ